MRWQSDNVMADFSAAANEPAAVNVRLLWNQELHAYTCIGVLVCWSFLCNCWTYCVALNRAKICYVRIDMNTLTCYFNLYIDYNTLYVYM